MLIELTNYPPETHPLIPPSLGPASANAAASATRQNNPLVQGYSILLSESGRIHETSI